jgi:two-component system, chemotaxis family, chemotaxis protein CheY
MARALIVDDDEQARRFTGSILESAGHDLFFAKNGEEAMKAFLRKGIEIVVTDLHMPNGDGLELIEALSGINPDVPIIAVSGTGEEMLGTAKMIGAVATLPKPVSPTGLLAAVEQAMAVR